jgi:hypothetical protein
MPLGLALLLSSGAVEAVPAKEACGLYTQAVYAAGNAWSGCELKRTGERPL